MTHRSRMTLETVDALRWPDYVDGSDPRLNDAAANTILDWLRRGDCEAYGRGPGNRITALVLRVGTWGPEELPRIVAMLPGWWAARNAAGRVKVFAPDEFAERFEEV